MARERMAAAVIKQVHENYPVRTVARLTGLTADLIRAWEKRYGVVRPKRGPRGARLYSAADIAHLRTLARVVGAGRAIGDVAGLSHSQLEALAAAPGGEAPSFSVAGPAERPSPDLFGDLIASVKRFDAENVERRLGESLIALGSRRFVGELVAPLLHTVGDLWSSGELSVAHEHLVSGVLRNLLSGLIRQRRNHGRRQILLATPAGERHEFGLLLAALVLLDAGIGVSYLGIDLPAADIVAAAHGTRASVVALGLVDGENRTQAASALQLIEKGLPRSVEIWLGGREAGAVRALLSPSRSRVIADLEQLEGEAARLMTLAKTRV